MAKKILFVCTGNTCRSPMAAGLLKKITGDRDIEAVSAGTSASTGAPASAEAIQAMEEEGVDIRDHVSKPLDGFLLEEADMVFVMTERHRWIITEWFKSMNDKVRLLRELDPVKDDECYPDIPDPIGQPVEEYRRVRDIMKRAIEELSREI